MEAGEGTDLFRFWMFLATFLVPRTLQGTPKRPPKAPLEGLLQSFWNSLECQKNEMILVSRRFQALLSKFLQRFSNRQCRGIRCDSSWVPEVCKIFLSTRSAQDGPEKNLRGVPLYPTLAKLGLDAR